MTTATGTSCPWCTGCGWLGVVPPGPCGPNCKQNSVSWYSITAAPQKFGAFNATNTTQTPFFRGALTDDEIERIAQRVAALLKETP